MLARMERLAPGDEIAGYRIQRVAGAGAIGVVYVAEHKHLGRVAAIKTLSSNYADDPEFRGRFVREQRAAALVDHESIVDIYDAGEEDGLLYLAMQYVPGEDVAQSLERRGGPLEVDVAVHIGRRIASALDAAHAKGVVHRDVKPANILLEHQPDQALPRCYLTDFGLTKHTAAATLTRAGQFVGTLSYMSPEQIEGDDVTGRADQYALGCVLYECLTAQPPFLPERGSNLTLLTAHLSAPVPPLATRRPGLPHAADAAFSRALAKRPEDRYPSCEAFVDELVAALTAAPADRVEAPTVRGDVPRGPLSGGPSAPEPPSDAGPAVGAGSTVRISPDLLPPAGGPITARPPSGAGATPPDARPGTTPAASTAGRQPASGAPAHAEPAAAPTSGRGASSASATTAIPTGWRDHGAGPTPSPVAPASRRGGGLLLAIALLVVVAALAGVVLWLTIGRSEAAVLTSAAVVSGSPRIRRRRSPTA